MGLTTGYADYRDVARGGVERIIFSSPGATPIANQNTDD
jgi:hypothetical protein